MRIVYVRDPKLHNSFVNCSGLQTDLFVLNIVVRNTKAIHSVYGYYYTRTNWNVGDPIACAIKPSTPYVI